MSYYAQHDRVGSAEAAPYGAIEISTAEYAEAVIRMGRGERVTIINGALTFYTAPVYLTDADGYYTGEADALPQGAPLITDKPEGFVRPKRVNGAWAEGEDPAKMLDDAKEKRTEAINAAAQAEITSGFVSAALGSPYTYDTELEDQINLMGSERKAAITGEAQPYKCADENGVKAYRMHTPAQLQQVLDDGAAMKLAALQKAGILKEQVAAAQTIDAVNAIVW